MTGWRHTRTTHGTECADCWDEHIEDVCLMADPDPASPCGECDGSGPHVRPGADTWTNRLHPHVPTRCLSCSHPIEPAR